MRFQVFRLGIALAWAMVSANAQWLNYPAPGTPLTREGKPNLSAKTPRARNGTPDLSGVWVIEPPQAGEIERLYGDLGAAVRSGRRPPHLLQVLGKPPHRLQAGRGTDSARGCRADVEAPADYG